MGLPERGTGEGAVGLQAAGPGMGPSHKSTGAEGPPQAPVPQASTWRLIHCLRTPVGTLAVSDAQCWLRWAVLGAKSPNPLPEPGQRPRQRPNSCPGKEAVSVRDRRVSNGGLCVLALRSEASDSPAPHLHPCGLGRVTGPSEPVTVSSTSQVPSKIWRKVTCNGPRSPGRYGCVSSETASVSGIGTLCRSPRPPRIGLLFSCHRSTCRTKAAPHSGSIGRAGPVPVRRADEHTPSGQVPDARAGSGGLPACDT